MFAPPLAKPKAKTVPSGSAKLAANETPLSRSYGDVEPAQEFYVSPKREASADAPGPPGEDAGPASVSANGGPCSRSWKFCDVPASLSARGNAVLAQRFPFQASLEIGAVDDPLEHDADRIADQVMRMPAPPVSPTAPLQMRPVGVSPPIAPMAQLSPGQPLDPATRAFMEPRFGRSFARVRVHTGATAENSARALGARAYTAGDQIVFGAGQFTPRSPAGSRLLAHELAHIVQQSVGRAPARIQAKPDPASSPRKPAPTRFWVKVNEELDSDALLREFVRQYYNETDEKEIDKKLLVWHWTDKQKTKKATKADVAKGGLFLIVTDFAQQQVAAMTPEQQKALNEQTDQRFWAETGYKPNEKLGSSPPDKEMARKWLGVRTDILIDNEASRQINALPADIKAILLAGDRRVRPDEYSTVLRLAAKLDRLTPEQRRDYLAKVNAASDSFADIDASIDRYLLQAKARETEEEKTEVAAAKLFNKEELYTLYRAKIAASKKSAAAFQRGGYSPPLQQAAQEAERKFTQALHEQGFKSEPEFTDALEAYRLRFRDEAVQLAMEVLAHYDHKLYVARVELQDPAKAASIVKGIGATKAAEHYKAAKQKFADAAAAQFGIDPMDKIGSARTRSEIARKQAEGRSLREEAEGEVVEGSGKDPLVDPKALGRGTDREKLASLDVAGAQQYLLQVIDERQADTNKARAEFVNDPERIFSIQDLVQATLQSQEIGANTIYAWIVRDHIADVRNAHLFTAIVLGIIALVLAALVPGGGWVAAAALVGSAVISTAQAYEAIKEYSEKETDYRLNFIQEEPSLLWVGVAVAGAALDLGMAASQVFKMSAAALKELEAPLKEFAAATDAETSAARLKALRDKIETVDGLEPQVRKALQAQLDAEATFKATMRSLHHANAMTPPGLAIKYFEVIYRAIRKGVSTITKLRKEAEVTELMADAAKLQGAGREELQTVFGQVKKVVQIGDKKGMDEATLLKYVDRLAEERGGGQGAFEAITEEMSVWRKPTADQIKAEKGLTEAREQLSSLRRVRDDAEAELRAGPKTPDGKSDLERIKELQEELKGLVETRLDPKTGRKVSVKGREITKAEQDVAAAELAAERAKVDPRDIMRQAFNGSEERAKVIQGVAVDQVGKLKTPPTVATVDHIVSIKRISEMEGFGKLTVKERNRLATLEKNLIVMDKSANASKGERSWHAWKQYSTFYDEATRDVMAVREADIYSEMQAWITETVRRR
jgi:hypothetical protein